MIRRISGTEYDSSCNRLTIGKTEIDFLSISYSDNLEIERVWEHGQQVPVARTPGQYKPGDGKLKVRGTVGRKEILYELPRIGAGNVVLNAVVSFSHQDIGDDSDLIEGFSILGASADHSNDSKAQEMEFTFTYRRVLWTSKRVCFGSTVGPSAVGVSRL